LTAGKKEDFDLKATRVWKSQTPVYGIAVHGNRLVTAGDGGLQIWNLEKNEPPIEATGVRSKPRAVAFTPDGKNVVSVGGQFIQVWDTETGHERCMMSFALQAISFTMVAVGAPLDDKERPTGLWTVVAADQTGTAHVLTIEADPVKTNLKIQSPKRLIHLVKRTELTGHAEPITGIRFSPDNKTIATTSEDRTVRLWDPLIGQERVTLNGHTDAVLHAVFLQNGTALISAGREGSLKIWHSPR
jgi:WD40 repeat protein